MKISSCYLLFSYSQRSFYLVSPAITSEHSLPAHAGFFLLCTSYSQLCLTSLTPLSSSSVRWLPPTPGRGSTALQLQGWHLPSPSTAGWAFGSVVCSATPPVACTWAWPGTATGSSRTSRRSSPKPMAGSMLSRASGHSSSDLPTARSRGLFWVVFFAYFQCKSSQPSDSSTALVGFCPGASAKVPMVPFSHSVKTESATRMPLKRTCGRATRSSVRNFGTPRCVRCTDPHPSPLTRGFSFVFNENQEFFYRLMVVIENLSLFIENNSQYCV